MKKLFTGLYLLAFVLIVMYLVRDELNISSSHAPLLYYGAMGIFVVGLARIFYLVLRRNR